MRRDAPVWLLLCTVGCFILLNVLVAQWIISAFYPQAVTRLGPAGIGALSIALVAFVIYTVRGWRTYLRRPPDT